MDISGSSLENPTAHGLARLLVVPSGAFAPHIAGDPGPEIAGDPGPETEQLQQVVAGADEQPFPVHLRQTPQQELPEAPALLDLAEHRFNRLHPKGVALTSSFRPQLAPHPVPDGQSLGYAATGRRLQHPAVAGLHLPWHLGSAYDDVYITAECLRQTSDDQDADGFRDCLYDITWSGAIGNNYSFDENGEVVGLSRVVVEVLPHAERTEENYGYRVLSGGQGK